MKVASLLLLTSVGLLLVPVLLLDGTPAPSAPAAQTTAVPPQEETPARPPAPLETPRPTLYALVPPSGREVVEAALALDAGRSEPLPRERQPLLDRAPERQARGLSGSA